MCQSRTLYEQLMEWQSAQLKPAELALQSDTTPNEDGSNEDDGSRYSPDWRERLAALAALGEELCGTQKYSRGRTICRRTNCVN